MKRFAILALLLASATANAWEAETTHAGLAEQAALSSRLHKRLVAIGFSGGLFEALTIPPADAPALISDLHLLSPSHGSVPDARGRQSALAWLAAGAALADVPAKYGANHFYDVVNGHGWTHPSLSVISGLADSVRRALGRASLPEHGVPAPDWVVAKDNPFNLAAFLDQYTKAATAATPGERSRHMAAALIAAGAMLHTLGDLGAPSRVRGDEAAHLQPLGGGPDDLGSRFERIAALAYGRLGVPAPSRTITRTHLRDYFVGPQKQPGLANIAADSYFSPGTLPHSTRVGSDTKPELARSLPALPARLNLMAASRDEGTTLRDAAGVCLARYKVEHSILSFALDDDCMLEEVTAILPEVAAYETGLLDFLFRGSLDITLGTQLVVSGTGLGLGDVDVMIEDDRGVRQKLATVQTIAARVAADKVSEIAHLPLPTTGTRVIAVFHGADAAGEPIVAVGSLPLAAR
jgi:hypothetical protein